MYTNPINSIEEAPTEPSIANPLQEFRKSLNALVSGQTGGSASPIGTRSTASSIDIRETMTGMATCCENGNAFYNEADPDHDNVIDEPLRTLAVEGTVGQIGHEAGGATPEPILQGLPVASN